MGLAQPGGCFAGLMVSPKDFASSASADEAFCFLLVLQVSWAELSEG